MEASRSTPCECLVTIPRSAPGDPRSKKTWTGLSLGEAQRTQRTSDARGVEKQRAQLQVGGFVTVVLKAAKLREEAQTIHEGKDLPEVRKTTRPVDQAENEVEMLAFLLEEADSSEAEVLLEMEAQLQEPKAPLVAAHLRAQIAELQGRQRSLSPPDREGHGDGDESSRDWAPMLAFLLGPSATFRYVSGGPLNQRRSLRRRSLQLLCWFASWKVWLEKRLAAYAAYFWYWELHSLEPPENRSARRKHLMQQAMAEQAAEEKQAQKAGAEPKESAEVASSAKQPEKEQRTATPEAPKPEETPEDTKEPEESKDSSEPREEAELTPLQQEHLKNLAKLLEEMQALQGMTPDPDAEG
ncbi:hypothetical protein AK812_SmicGene3711 [Symbiodinium microadriaticum]|uniref:Uncharacterized protein n=1 Tax=Symbiodinium microadriaticum TaxID=2951 RepID=A0A1Q9EYA3_SYMMI|nr:hypothetical protein AK812_SmicGene3711 [Symbiodinium microadriaticum]CAE7901587.1 unnamed protein product [Symbiodinium microadriaticum]CAE7903800.1 unnamed protein product [Symbiodinium sp. KB8]